jgi:D-glycero-D-manno-heptose 1,7-bisphosphate phosphatase
VFLDRDGTIVVEKNYITIPDMIELLPGAAEAILALRSSGFKVFVVTNQACVAKGMITEEELAQINLRMVALLGAEGAVVDGIYCCMHHPEGTVPAYTLECDCRKPKPGLLEQAAREHGVDLARSVMIGDTRRDIDAGKAVGAATVLVRTGKGERAVLEVHGADHVAVGLAEAVGWWMRGGGA